MSSSRLIESAQEFEAQLMKELLRPMTGSDDEDESRTGFAGALTDFAAEGLGRALSKSGGFGIAASIVHSLSGFGTQSREDPAVGKSGSDMRDRLK